MLRQLLILRRFIPCEQFFFSGKTNNHGAPVRPIPFKGPDIVIDGKHFPLKTLENFVIAIEVSIVPMPVMNIDLCDEVDTHMIGLQ